MSHTPALMTLNGGFALARGKQTSDEDRAMIDSFIKNKGVTQCPPSGCDGNEISPDTHERVMEARKQFRTNAREKKKQEQAKGK